MDHAKVDSRGILKSELGHFLQELDREIRKAPTIEKLEITEPMKEMFKKIATVRVRTDRETVEDCHKRLLEDAGHFLKIYRKRGRKNVF